MSKLSHPPLWAVKDQKGSIGPGSISINKVGSIESFIKTFDLVNDVSTHLEVICSMTIAGEVKTKLNERGRAMWDSLQKEGYQQVRIELNEVTDA